MKFKCSCNYLREEMFSSFQKFVLIIQISDKFSSEYFTPEAKRHSHKNQSRLGHKKGRGRQVVHFVTKLT